MSSKPGSTKSASDKMASAKLTWASVLFIAVISFSAGVMWNSDWVNAVLLDEPAEKPQDALVTYYQWNDDKGRVMVSTIQPKGVDYITFKASQALTQYKYQLDPKLLSEAQKYHDDINEKVGRKTSSSSSDSGQFDLIDKARRCTEMVSEIRSLQFDQVDANKNKNNKGKKSNSERLNELQQQIAEVCDLRN